MPYCFDYILKKLKASRLVCDPFPHIYIEDFFNGEHFNELVGSYEIKAPPAESDEELISELEARGFKSIKFPGSITNKDSYIDWHSSCLQSEDISRIKNTACEGVGYVMRLYEYESAILGAVQKFFGSEEFHQIVSEKLGIEGEWTYDGGIQKYLDGYEISPHPDVRLKAATWMININPAINSHSIDYHTHYMKFTENRKYVEAFWMGNQSVERAWVPWGWAKTIKQQIPNNSIVLFAPSDSTLHGVKAHYDHLTTQRTQIYGNLWYQSSTVKFRLGWEELDLLKKTDLIKAREDVGQGSRNVIY